MPSPIRTVAEHRRIVLDQVRQKSTMDLAPLAAEGLTLREAARAAFPVPPFVNSSMDGFAVRFQDVREASVDSPVVLKVVADIPAGVNVDPPLAAGEAIRIMTGSPMPSAADTIVPFEDTVGGLADSLADITITAAPKKIGSFVRHAGEDVAIGDIVLTAGTVLGPRQIASLVATGVKTVAVSSRPKVAILSTGTELVAAGEPLERGQIPDTNGNLLAGLARAVGAEIHAVISVPDETALFRQHLDDLLVAGVDVVCFSGGVSAGAYEVVRNTLSESGEMQFGPVAMQPGKPQGFGVSASGALLFGLPGNPVSSAVSFEAFVRPALVAMQGRNDIDKPRLRLRVSSGWSCPPDREQYVPVIIDRRNPDAWLVAPATDAHSASHLIGTLGLAEALAIVPAEAEEIREGDYVDVVSLP